MSAMGTPAQDRAHAERKLRDVIEAVGGGFHPDTPGDGYTSLPEWLTPELVDEAVSDAIANDVDPYELALEVLS